MNLKQRQNKKTKKPSNNIPNWVVSLIVTFGILLYFILGSWQLSFVIDQLKCKNKLPNCLFQAILIAYHIDPIPRNTLI